MRFCLSLIINRMFVCWHDFLWNAVSFSIFTTFLPVERKLHIYIAHCPVVTTAMSNIKQNTKITERIKKKSMLCAWNERNDEKRNRKMHENNEIPLHGIDIGCNTITCIAHPHSNQRDKVVLRVSVFFENYSSMNHWKRTTDIS